MISEEDKDYPLYDVVENFCIPIKLYRRKWHNNLKDEDIPIGNQLSIFCHSGWFEENNLMNPVPFKMFYYTNHDIALNTEVAISSAITNDSTSLPIKEIVEKPNPTYDYSMRPNEKDAELSGLWEAAALAGENPPDLLLVTGLRDEHAETKFNKYYRLSDIFLALNSELNNQYSICRFYGCRTIIYRFDDFSNRKITSKAQPFEKSANKRSSYNYDFSGFAGKLKLTCPKNIQFNIMRVDETSESDTVLFENVQNDDLITLELTELNASDGIYIANPRGAQEDFEISFTRVI